MTPFDHSKRPLPAGMRGFKAPRCERCWMLSTACICELLPRRATATRVVLAMGWKEALRSSNTGRWAHLALPNSQIVLHGRPDGSFDPGELLQPAERGLLLFPDEDAEEIGPAHRPEPDRPVALVVPDGAWRWARRFFRRLAGRIPIQAVRLPPGPPSAYRLRRAQAEDRICTYEAIARALGALEGPEVERELLQPFAAIMERALAARGGARRG